jgi:hypothetical protein
MLLRGFHENSLRISAKTEIVNFAVHDTTSSLQVVSTLNCDEHKIGKRAECTGAMFPNQRQFYIHTDDSTYTETQTMAGEGDRYYLGLCWRYTHCMILQSPVP